MHIWLACVRIFWCIWVGNVSEHAGVSVSVDLPEWCVGGVSGCFVCLIGWVCLGVCVIMSV